MRELDDVVLERHLRDVLEEHLGALPLDLTVDALERRREAKGVARRFGRGRGMTLLAAAALLLVGGALAAGSGFVRLPTVVPPVPSPSVVAVATASPDATSPTPSESPAPSASPIPVAGPGGVWITTGSMVTPRSEHDAVRLLDGRVLVVGGSGGETDPATAELYDPASGTWSSTGSMVLPLGRLPATLLRDGRVLVGDVTGGDTDHPIYGAELYDPATGTWSSTAGLVIEEAVGNAVATLLADGRVLATGLQGSQLYDPDSDRWTAAETMITPRYNHTATLLADGRVLVAGGDRPPDRATDSAELYDPETGSWTATASLQATTGYQWPFDAIKALPLRDGTVLIVRPSTTETYDPATGTWTATPRQHKPNRVDQSATLLTDGTVLVIVRDVVLPIEPPQAVFETTAERYDPSTGTWAAAGAMLRQHEGVPATPLLDGTVLVAGGSDCLDDRCVASSAAELYVPAGVSLPPLPAFPNPGPPVFPSPSPKPTPFPPADGPVPPNARTWKVTVENKSSNPTTLFVADETGRGTLGRLVGSVTPNVVPPGSTVEVTFTLPAKGVEGWAIFVNPRPDDGSLVGAAEIGMPGKILDEGGPNQTGWVSP